MDKDQRVVANLIFVDVMHIDAIYMAVLVSEGSWVFRVSHQGRKEEAVCHHASSVRNSFK